MVKKQLIRAIQDKVNEVDKEANLKLSTTEELFESFVTTIVNTIGFEEEPVVINGFGRFDYIIRENTAPRKNPLTGETVKIKPSKNMKFKASKAFKEAVNVDKSLSELLS